jgi:hypothetical protein
VLGGLTSEYHVAAQHFGNAAVHVTDSYFRVRQVDASQLRPVEGRLGKTEKRIDGMF